MQVEINLKDPKSAISSLKHSHINNGMCSDFSFFKAVSSYPVWPSTHYNSPGWAQIYGLPASPSQILWRQACTKKPDLIMVYDLCFVLRQRSCCKEQAGLKLKLILLILLSAWMTGRYSHHGIYFYTRYLNDKWKFSNWIAPKSYERRMELGGEEIWKSENVWAGV